MILLRLVLRRRRCLLFVVGIAVLADVVRRGFVVVVVVVDGQLGLQRCFESQRRLV